MKKFIALILCFLTVSIICEKRQNVNALPTPLDMIDPEVGGYSHKYNFGTFGINSEIGENVMLVNHYVYANNDYALAANSISLNYTAYTPYVTTPTIYQSEISGNFAWVKARTYFTLTPHPGYIYGQHGEYKQNASKIY